MRVTEAGKGVQEGSENPVQSPQNQQGQVAERMEKRILEVLKGRKERTRLLVPACW